MILFDFLTENSISLSEKGIGAMGKAIHNIYPNMSLWYELDDVVMVGRVIHIDLPESDCLQILQLTARYAGLWAFT